MQKPQSSVPVSSTRLERFRVKGAGSLSSPFLKKGLGRIGPIESSRATPSLFTFPMVPRGTRMLRKPHIHLARNEGRNVGNDSGDCY